MEYVYRIGTLNDKEKLQKLGINSYGHFKKVLTKENWDKMNSFLTAENTYTDLLSKAKCFVCENRNEIIGIFISGAER